MSSKQPRKQRLARYNAPYHRRHREMAAPVDRGLRERQLSRGFMYPRAMPVRKGDRVLIARGEGKGNSTSSIAKVDRKARKVYIEGFTYFKSDGTELQRPIDASNLIIVNPDWTDVRRRKMLNRINEAIEWTDEMITEFEAAEDEYETEAHGDSTEEKTETPEEGAEEVADSTEEETETPEEGAEEVADYESMTVAQLKDVLKEKGLPVSGKKSELIDRLKEGNK